jgi:hypothetical protein
MSTLIHYTWNTVSFSDDSTTMQNLQWEPIYPKDRGINGYPKKVIEKRGSVPSIWDVVTTKHGQSQIRLDALRSEFRGAYRRQGMFHQASKAYHLIIPGLVSTPDILKFQVDRQIYWAGCGLPVVRSHTSFPIPNMSWGRTQLNAPPKWRWGILMPTGEA